MSYNPFGGPDVFGIYDGVPVSRTFMDRWRSAKHTGSARPACQVLIRRGRMERRWHDDWPAPQFGQLFGKPVTHQWYPDWTPLEDWNELEGIAQVDLDQSFSNNGITTATVTADNVQWQHKTGPGGSYHKRQRGYLWPWRGYVPPDRPGSQDGRNAWWAELPNAQILVKQGYGADTMVPTFTGLVDDLDETVRPDRMTLTCRDFGSILADTHLWGWNIAKINDPIIFAPRSYERFAWVQRQASKTNHRWIIIDDATEIVKVILRWAGFKEWEIEPAGVNLTVPYTADKSKTYMDVINDLATALGYVFFIAEPNPNNDLSIGVPIFRRPSVVVHERSQPIHLGDGRMLTDLKPKHDNTDDRAIIRVRGVMNRKIGRTFGGDSAKRVTAVYWPPWFKDMAGVIKQLTYYDIGSNGVLGLQDPQQCMVAVMLIAIQISLARDTAIAQCPGQPHLGLDCFAYVTDNGTGINSRLYITNRKSTMTLGGDGTSQQKSPYGTSGSSQSELLWATELGGSLCDNPPFAKVINDYNRAIRGENVFSWAPQGWD